MDICANWMRCRLAWYRELWGPSEEEVTVDAGWRNVNMRTRGESYGGRIVLYNVDEESRD